ncbi:hypothetical protein B0H13DRAFT_1907399 [Mycena leptocephala]|nr:hypothetical protein B0H13DRAFT_1907399 [Mycena leptocephala]
MLLPTFGAPLVQLAPNSPHPLSRVTNAWYYLGLRASSVEVRPPPSAQLSGPLPPLAPPPRAQAIPAESLGFPAAAARVCNHCMRRKGRGQRSALVCLARRLCALRATGSSTGAGGEGPGPTHKGARPDLFACLLEAPSSPPSPAPRKRACGASAGCGAEHRKCKMNTQIISLGYKFIVQPSTAQYSTCYRLVAHNLIKCDLIIIAIIPLLTDPKLDVHPPPRIPNPTQPNPKANPTLTPKPKPNQALNPRSRQQQPFLGFFTGMMSQFMRESMANGSLPAFVGNTAGTATLPTPLPTLPLPPVIPYSSSRSQPIALPAAPTGHPLPSRNFLASVRRSRCLAWVALVSLCLTTPTIPAIAAVLKTSARPRYPRRTPLAVLQQENILVPLVLPFNFAWGISCAFAHWWQARRLCDPRAPTFCAVLIAQMFTHRQGEQIPGHEAL